MRNFSKLCLQFSREEVSHRNSFLIHFVHPNFATFSTKQSTLHSDSAVQFVHIVNICLSLSTRTMRKLTFYERSFCCINSETPSILYSLWQRTEHFTNAEMLRYLSRQETKKCLF